MRIPLAVIICGILCVAVLVVAAVTLSLASSSAFAALREIGTTHAGALSDVAKESTLRFFEIPKRGMTQIKLQTKRAGYKLPKDMFMANPQWWYLYVQTLIGAIQITSPATYFAAVSFMDGSFMQCSATPFGYACGWTNCGVQITVPSSPLPLCVGGSAIEFTNGTLVDLSATSPPTVLPNFLLLPAMAVSLQLSMNGTIGIPWTYPVLAAEANGDYSFQLPVVIESFNNSGTFVTSGSVSLMIDDLDTFLDGLDTTPNTYAFLMDSTNFLIGSSHPLPFFNYTAWNGTPPVSIAPGCSDTGALAFGATSGRVYCRTAAAAFPFAPLQAVMGSPIINSANRTVSRMSLNGANYYVSVSPIVTGLGYFNAKLVLVLPERDVIGNIVESRNISIGITVAVFVAIAAIASGLIVFLLRPLDDVAQRMYWAASFRDTAEPLQKSAINEIYALQHAYEAMNKQLILMKCFLPANLLHTDADDLEEAIEAAGSGDVAAARYSEAGKATGTEGRNTKKSGSAHGDGTESVASRRSLRSDASKRVGGVVGAAHVGLSCAMSTVTVVAVNLQNLHQRTARWTADELLRSFTDVVSLVERQVLDHRGVVDFHGDRFFATFNSVRPCVNHAVRAMSCAAALPAEIAAKGCPATVGLATGKAHVGNLGCSSLKRHCTVGPVYTKATVLERLCRLYDAGVLVAGVTGEGQTNVFVQALDAIRLPGSADLTTVAAVHARAGLLDAKAPAGRVGEVEEKTDGEWMYEMAAGEAANPFNAMNAVFVAAAAGDVAGAAALLEAAKAKEMPPLANYPAALFQVALKNAQQLVDGKSRTEEVAKLYYTTCVAPTAIA